MEEYVHVHSWLDATKAHCADFRHRALRHHSQGIFWAQDRFGKAIINSAGLPAPVRYVAEIHILEDCSTIPTLSDWARELRVPDWWRGDLDARAHARASAEEFGGHPGDHLWVHEWLDKPRKWLPEVWGWVRHNAEEVHEMATLRPSYRLANGRLADTRAVAEAHVRRTCEGRVPPACDWLRRFRRCRWMAKPSRVRVDANGRPRAGGNLTRPAVPP